MGAAIYLTPVPSAVTAGPPGSYTRGEELVINWTVKDTDGVVTAPDDITFTVRTPGGVDTEYTTADPELVDNADGTGTFTIVLDESARWVFRCVTDTPTTAAEVSTLVARSPFETPVIPVPGAPGIANEGALARAASGVYSPYLGEEAGEGITWDGSIWVKRRGWVYPDVDTTGTTDATAAITAALATRAGCCVYLPEGSIKITSQLVIPDHGVSLVGSNMQATELVCYGAAGVHWIASTSKQGVAIRNLKMRRATMPSATPSGYAIKLTDTFSARVECVWTEQMENGISLVQALDTRIVDFKPRNGFGSRSILVSGTSAYGGQTYIEHLRCEAGGYPYGYPAAFDDGMAAAWTTGQAVTQGDIRVTAGVLIWQCSTSGTTAASGSGPTSLPSTDPTLARSLEVTDNTAKWRYVGRADHAGVCADSYSGDVFVRDSAVLNGGLGFLAQDVAVPGNAPQIIWIDQLQVDHPLDYGALINAGSDVRVHGAFGSCLRGPGVVIGTGVYDWVLHELKALGNAKEGIFANSSDGAITDCRVGHNSQLTTNTYDGIVAAGDDNVLTGNRSGNIWEGGTANPQRYGLNYASGAHYVIVGNWFRGNTTGQLTHPSGSGAQVANNVIA